MTTNLMNKSIEELIEFCKEKGIDFLTKAKKPMAKKTILSKLKKLGLIEDDEDDDLDTETTDINIIIRKTHNYLYKSAGIVGSKAQNDIMRILTMRIFNIILSKNNSYLVSVLDDDNISDKCLLHLWTFKMPFLVFIILVFSYFIFLNIIFLSIICSV
jgi:hypothetical protein